MLDKTKLSQQSFLFSLISVRLCYRQSIEKRQLLIEKPYMSEKLSTLSELLCVLISAALSSGMV
jgi:hypothetical protein